MKPLTWKGEAIQTARRGERRYSVALGPRGGWQAWAKLPGYFEPMRLSGGLFGSQALARARCEKHDADYSSKMRGC